MNEGFVKEMSDRFAQPSTLDVDGDKRLVVPPGWQDATPRLPEVSPLEFHQLQGLADYLEANVDAHEKKELLLVVSGPDRVDLFEKIGAREDRYQRHRYASVLVLGKTYPFGSYLDAETFQVALQTQFVDTDERRELLALTASISDSAVRNTVDDGVAQEVSTKRGVTLSNRTKVPNPVRLRPFRTFREIEQPESAFVIRLKSGSEEGPLVSLHEADGGAWRIVAVNDIVGWLRANVKGVSISG
jgi:hypothetical protein